MNLPALAEMFVKGQRSPNTERAYRGDLGKWFDFIAGCVTTTEKVLEFRRKLEAEHAPSTAVRIWSAVRSYYDWLEKQGHIESNPLRAVKAPRMVSNHDPEAPADSEVDRLIAAIDDSTLMGKKTKAIIMLLLNGLRASEVTSLRVQDFYQDEKYGWILKVIGKGMKERTVPATREVVDAVLAFRATTNRPKSQWLIHGTKGRQLTYRQVAYAVNSTAEAAGLPEMHPHALRHHYATRLVEAGVNPFWLQRLMGHSKADTTAKYVTARLSELVEAASLDPRNAVKKAALRVLHATA